MFGFLGWSIRWSLATVFFLGVMAAAGFYVFSQAVAGGEYVTVPNIVNLPILEASSRLGEAGLEVGRQTARPSDQVPAYHVIAQRPEAGRVVRVGRKVFPIVSQGEDVVTAPNLVGKSLDQVESTWAQGFRLGTTARLAHSAPRDQVIGQDPGPGRPMTRGAEISLLVSDGSSQDYQMPDLVGMRVEEAMRRLASLPINAVPNRVDRPEAEFDVVLAQRPMPGAILHEGDDVSYDIRVSGQVELPRARRKVEVVYEVPDSWFDREVRIEVVDKNETRLVVLPSQGGVRRGDPAQIQAGGA